MAWQERLLSLRELKKYFFLDVINWLKITGFVVSGKEREAGERRGVLKFILVLVILLLILLIKFSLYLFKVLSLLLPLKYPYLTPWAQFFNRSLCLLCSIRAGEDEQMISVSVLVFGQRSACHTWAFWSLILRSSSLSWKPWLVIVLCDFLIILSLHWAVCSQCVLQ